MYHVISNKCEMTVATMAQAREAERLVGNGSLPCRIVWRWDPDALAIAARERTGANNAWPVEFVLGDSPPRIMGEGFHWTNRSGDLVRHPSAYSRKGWRSLVYHHSTKRVEVGRDWRP